ncbi:hypothetical protein GGE45_002577 [Rhizobium aethiopicum]|uniref:Uncharacterized protein n=1 Tax=Rhizobium aethiopicum TaxID=1138170 RepID=A0A7W6MCI5_9HYPH|nr:hypothetical protein [Rhizobium aethiopicum]MBB4190014.1 hypothetical protein [Rhizobium aethiopicum]MBB4580247.1 hypothetical protein [Rhizobium aethiopicum]
MPQNRWTSDLQHMRSLPRAGQKSMFLTFIEKECGIPLTVREARSRLFLLTMDALAGSPRLIVVDETRAILMSLGDLEAILLDLALMKVVEGLKEQPRRRVKNR